MALEENKELKKKLNLLEKYSSKQTKERIKRVTNNLIEKKLPEPLIEGIILKTIKNKINSEEEKMFSIEAHKIAEEIIQMEEVIQRNYSKLPNETITSIILTLPQDFQPIIVKIEETADALYHKEKIIYEEQYAKKAFDIWLPLATKLGISECEWKIQDYSFRVLNPQAFEKIKKLINKTRTEREQLIEEVITEIQELLKNKPNTTITGRPKSFTSIFNKLKKTSFEKIHDIYGIRIICNKEKECYEILGLVHSKYDIIQEAFDDYISKPKPNGYKSIHTAVKRKEEVIEVQIRTWAQHLRISGETYWTYKKINKDQEFEKELSWERQLLEWQKQTGEEKFEKKIAGNKIFTFTPKNDAIPLPREATALDFAFAVHTEIGKKAEKVKINGQLKTLETKLNNLDKIEIITNPKTQMKKSWLQNVITEKAKTKIKTHFQLNTKKISKEIPLKMKDTKKIKMAECCHPLPGEDVIGVKTTKRKIIIHKKDCPNIKKLTKEKLLQINFEREKGETGIRIKAIDRNGLLGEILEEIKNSGATLKNTNFKIKKNGYIDAMFSLEIKNAQKLEKLIEKINSIPSIQLAQRI
ncbi:MAG: (p)ppGpp synthetase I/GTP pyrophosphokinase [archaeon ADurb.Bin336]|nr:MAG: (p)ppGpp synthetase I/GTP pyrophosphokinase [archaeon ADurb.Bin336]